MKAYEAVRRSGVGISSEQTIHEAAAVMEQAGVGALAVIDGPRIVGIVTDRDLVRRGLARDLASDARVDGIMTAPVVTIEAEADVRDAFAIFRSHPIRRLAVVQGDRFIGMISVDDLLINVAAELNDLARPITGETLFAHHDSPVPATR